MIIKITNFNDIEYNSSLDIEPLKKYSIGNSFEHDIFLNLSEVGLVLLFTIQVTTDNKIIFYQARNIYNQISNNVIHNETNYAAPIKIIVENFQIEILDLQQNDVKENEKDTNLNEVNSSSTNLFFSDDIINAANIKKDSEAIKPQRETIEVIIINFLIITIPTLLKNAIKALHILVAPWVIWLKHKFLSFSKLLQTIIIFTTIVSLILSFSFVYYLKLMSNQHKKITERVHTRQTIEDLYKKLLLQFPSLILLNTDNNTFRLLGLVSNQQEVNEITSRLSMYKKILTLQISSADQITMMVQNKINALGYKNITFNYNQNSHSSSLQGIVNDPTEVNTLEVALNNEFPQIGDLDVSGVYLIPDILASLNQIIKSDPFGDSFVIRQSLPESVIYISGYLSNDDIAIATSQFKELQSKFPPLKIVVDFKNILDVLPFQIMSIYIGQQSYLISSAGQKYYVGSVINGFQVTSITTEKVTFKGDVPIVIYLTASNALDNERNAQTVNALQINSMESTLANESQNPPVLR